jgi:DEAD/DEAH box helicase domain-containing protein
MMLACWDCRNLEKFAQVSARGDSRSVLQSTGGLKAAPWDQPDSRDPGLYCAGCHKKLDFDAADLDLADSRVGFVSPEDFDADALAKQLVATRSDAGWTRLELPAQAARFREPEVNFAPELAAALERLGRRQLYVHQADAVEAAARGENVVQATPAGSGKSLGFMLPVLDALARNKTSTALLVFPLKALANDQLASIARFCATPDPWLDDHNLEIRLTAESDPIHVSRYDGSTPDGVRRTVRKKARLIIATPDMLHSSILRMAHESYRDGSSWLRILQGLELVVLDEIHAYQGVFGSAVANTLRRLRRSATRCGSSPKFLAASATIGNPVELAETLTGASPFTLVDDDGSGRQRRVVLICNPPERHAALNQPKGDPPIEGPPDEDIGRIAPQTIAIDVVAGEALGSPDHPPVRTIGFCQSRNAVFQLSKRIQGRLAELRRTDLVPHVAGYAATYLEDERADQEGRLRDGTTLAIISTNALELGIDIPDLSLAVLVGYPGRIASFRQRIGRVGRSGEGLAVLIVGDDPLQQFLARDPNEFELLLAGRAEEVVINPYAPEIVRRYGLLPAQSEFGGISFEDALYFGEDAVRDWLVDATGPPDKEIAGIRYWLNDSTSADDAYRALRSTSLGKNYTVLVKSGRDRTAIGTIDAASAPRDAFVPAIWSGPKGELFQVTSFDHKLGEVYCEGPIESNFLTRGVPVNRVEITGNHEALTETGGAAVGYAPLTIARHVFSYKEQHFSGLERSVAVESGWPPVEFNTDGLYLRVNQSLFADDLERDGSIRAVEHVLLSVAPALVACDPYDLDASSDSTCIYIFDSFGGGLRLSSPLYQRFGDLVDLGLKVVEGCSCESGCPSCIMLSRRPDGNRDLSKAGALKMLRVLKDPA